MKMSLLLQLSNKHEIGGSSSDSSGAANIGRITDRYKESLGHLKFTRIEVLHHVPKRTDLCTVESNFTEAMQYHAQIYLKKFGNKLLIRKGSSLVWLRET